MAWPVSLPPPDSWAITRPGGRGAMTAPCGPAGPDGRDQAVSRSRSRWLTTVDTPSPRMLIPYSESATSMVRF